MKNEYLKNEKRFGFIVARDNSVYIRVRGIRGKWQKLRHWRFDTLQEAYEFAKEIYGKEHA